MWFGYIFVGFPLFCVVIFAGVSKIYVKLTNQRTIAKLTEHHVSVETLRDGAWKTLDAEDLAPGDVVKVQDDWVLPCDMIVLQGSCVLNESALTGMQAIFEATYLPFLQRRYGHTRSKF